MSFLDSLRDWYLENFKSRKVKSAREELKERSPAIMRRYSKDDSFTEFSIQCLPERIDTLPASAVLKLQKSLHGVNEIHTLFSESSALTDKKDNLVEEMFLINLNLYYSLNGWFLNKFVSEFRKGRLKL